MRRACLIFFAFTFFVGFYGPAIFGCGGRTKSTINPVPESQSGSQKGVIHYINDHLGNAHLITDPQGNILREESRYPYGLDWRVDGSAATTADYVYTGKEYDEETDLVYFGGRYYSPEMGRWITPDPLFLEKDTKKLIDMPRELNLYAYVPDNPVNYIDESGLFSIRVLGDSDFKRNQFTAVVYGKQNEYLGAFPIGRKALGKGPLEPGTYLLGEPRFSNAVKGMVVPIVDPATKSEFLSNGRTYVLIHAGADNAFKENSGFKETLGCLRTHETIVGDLLDFFDPASVFYEHYDPNGNVIQINQIGELDDSPPVPATSIRFDDWRD